MPAAQLKQMEPAEKAPRTRDRERTLKALRLALHRLQRSGKKISISAVATEAGVTAQLLHTRYPDFTEEIRLLTGKATRQQRNEKHELLQAEREKNRELREQITTQLKEITQLTSVNEALRQEIVLLKALADKKVIRGTFSGGKC